MGRFYTEYSDFLTRLFPGVKVQKISIDAGHNCPNRDGTLGRGGCIYCNNSAFSPSYCHTAGSVHAQIEQGRRFFARKYPSMQYLAYFQAYTSTHAPFAELQAAYEEALSCPGTVGLVIGTRPDCMPPALLDYLAEVNRSRVPVIVEYGVESLHDTTLDLIRRRHTAECALETIAATRHAGIPTGAHLIMGLPGESLQMMLHTVNLICARGIDILKFHQLQVVKGTALWEIWNALQNGLPLPSGFEDFPDVRTDSLEEYISLCRDIISLVPRTTAIERFTAQCPPQLLAAPSWGIKNHEFVNLLHSRLCR